MEEITYRDELELQDDPDELVRVLMRLPFPDDYEDPPFPEDAEQDDDQDGDE